MSSTNAHTFWKRDTIVLHSTCPLQVIFYIQFSQYALLFKDKLKYFVIFWIRTLKTETSLRFCVIDLTL